MTSASMQKLIDNDPSLQTEIVHLSSLQEQLKLASSLKTHHSLKCLRVIFSHYTAPLDISELFESLKINRSITTLKLTKNHLGDLGEKVIAAFLRVNTTLSELYLDSCEFNNISDLAEAIGINCNLQILNLSNNKFGNNGGKALALALSINTTLTELSLGSCNLQNITELSNSIGRNRALKKLNLGGNKFGNDGGRSLAAAIHINASLIELELGHCSIERISEISREIQHNKTIRKLNLSFNAIGNKGINALASALRINSTLNSLDLTDCDCDDIKELTKMLEVNHSIQKLDLGINELGNQGVKNLAVSLSKNSSLTELDIGFCKIQDIRDLAEVIKLNRTLRALTLNHNKFGNKGGGITLASALMNNFTLTNLEIDNCDIRSDIKTCILAKVEYNEALAEEAAEKKREAESTRKQEDEKDRKSNVAEEVRLNSQKIIINEKFEKIDGAILEDEADKKLKDFGELRKMMEKKVSNHSQSTFNFRKEEVPNETPTSKEPSKVPNAPNGGLGVCNHSINIELREIGK